jgi:hypothetical protein
MQISNIPITNTMNQYTSATGEAAAASSRIKPGFKPNEEQIEAALEFWVETGTLGKFSREDSNEAEYVLMVPESELV